jgi:methylmalonyl-CoA mutase
MASVSIRTLYVKEDAPAESLRSHGALKIAIARFQLPDPSQLEGVDALLLRAPDFDVARLDAALGGAAPEVLIDTSGAWAPASAAILCALAERRPGLTGCFGSDPLRAFARGLPLDWDQPVALFDIPGFRVIRHSSAPYSDAGAGASDQLAFLFATLLDTLRNLERRGIAPDQAAARTSLQIELDCDQFLGIASLRAARACWARIAQVIGFDAPAILHAETARRVLTERDPWVNLLRGTVTSFAAITGGADYVTVAPFDAIAGVPGGLAVRLARNTSLLLKEEAHLDHTIDPAGGSWYVERLTRELAESAWSTLQEIEQLGGMQAVLTSGWVDRRLADARKETMALVASRKLPITGVSEFPDLFEKPLRTAPYVPPAEIEPPRLSDLPAAIEAAKGGASLAGIAHALLRGGATRKALPVTRLAEPFEALRNASDRHRERTGTRPQIFLARLGPISEHTARSTWAKNLFEAGGVQAITGEGDQIGAFMTSGAHAAIICSSDQIYAAEADRSARALKAAGAKPLYLAGEPNDCPVDAFVHRGIDVIALLRELHRSLGVQP